MCRLFVAPLPPPPLIRRRTVIANSYTIQLQAELVFPLLHSPAPSGVPPRAALLAESVLLWLVGRVHRMMPALPLR